MKKIIIIVFCCLLPVAVLAIIALSRQKSFPLPIQNNRVLPISEENTVRYSDSGYSPSTITIKTGVTVIFQNDISGPMWPASDVHPIHTMYPGSGIHKCDKVPAGTIFDACTGIQPGDSWSFNFTEVGTWKYHDHLSPRYTGTISVTE